MNIQNSKKVIYANCKKIIDRVDYESLIIHHLRGQCANPWDKRDDILYTMNKYQIKSLKILYIV